MIHPFLLKQFIELINHQTGLAIRPQDRENLVQKLEHRIQCLKIASVESYYQLLVNQSQHSQEEWKHLINVLTTGESYFFRDRGQIHILRHYILPELVEIERQGRDSGTGDRPSLKLWSAGCSTGEEVYSLAILLMETIPDWREWNLQVLGTDINSFAISKAVAGLYNDWSFRMVDPTIQQRYFEPENGLWKIKDEVQAIARFQVENLTSTLECDRPVEEFNSIVCRNVLIYLTQEAINESLDRFCRALKTHGYLMTSHTETHGYHFNGFRVKCLPESIVYQKKCSHLLSDRGSKTINLENKLRFSNPSIKSRVLFAPDDYPGNILDKSAPQSPVAIDQNLPSDRQGSGDFSALFAIAQSYANLGQLQLGIDYAQQCLSINSLAVEPYDLLAQIAEEQGEIEQAKLYLKRIIYIEPQQVSAYLDLGALYAQQGNKKQARKFWMIALDLLNNSSIDFSDQKLRKKGTVQELILSIKKHLQDIE